MEETEPLYARRFISGLAPNAGIHSNWLHALFPLFVVAPHVFGRQHNSPFIGQPPLLNDRLGSTHLMVEDGRAQGSPSLGRSSRRMYAGAIASDSRLSTPSIASAADAPLISLAGVWRSWGRGRSRRDVLRGIDLEIASGTATCITGRNGVGKTTLLRIITGILAPDRGAVSVGGIGPTDSWRDYHRQIGFLSAGDRGLYARVTVQGHLEHWSALALVPRRERRERVQGALAAFDLTELAALRADRLSQGQRQRLRLALTVVHQPSVLLLDEPRNSLDPDGRELLAAAVRDVMRRGGAVVCCAPAGDDELDDWDRRAVIDDGSLRLL